MYYDGLGCGFEGNRFILLETPQPCLDPHKSESHDVQSRKTEINENVLVKIQPSGRYSEVTFVFRVVRLEFAFGHLGVMTAHAS